MGATGEMVSHIFLRGKAVVSKATDLFEIMYVCGCGVGLGVDGGV